MATSDDATAGGGARERTAPHPPAATEEGGDPACWLPLVCPDCGRLAAPPLPATCQRCGAQIPAIDT